MLKHIQEFDKYVLITGFNNVKIREPAEFLKKIQKEKSSSVEIQFFDAQCVASWQHLYFAALNALKAFKNKENISKSLAVETILYTSAQRQIRKAMELLGITSKTSRIAMLIIADNPQKIESVSQMVSAFTNRQCDDMVLELTEEKKVTIQKAFGISDVELEAVMKKSESETALINLVIERMALLATQR